MALSVSLERLVHALSSSIIRAQNLVEKAQLANLRSFFDNNNIPISIDLKLPSMQHEDEGAKDTYRVPLAALVPHGSLVIKEAKIRMDVEIGSVTQDPEPPEGYPDLAEIVKGTEPIRPKLIIDPEGGGVAKTKNGNTARITLTLSATENTEGLARLLNEVIKGQGRIPDTTKKPGITTAK
jgi:hypothetical protein